MTEQELSSVIWGIKEIIRGLYDDAEVEDVFLPFTLLRRLGTVCLMINVMLSWRSLQRFLPMPWRR